MTVKRKRSESSKTRAKLRQEHLREQERMLRPWQNNEIVAYVKDRKTVMTKGKIALDLEHNEFWWNTRLDTPTGYKGSRYADNGWTKIEDFEQFKTYLESRNCVIIFRGE